MFVPLLTFAVGLLLGWIWWHQPLNDPEWRLQIIMNIVNGGNYPLSLQLTRKGKVVALPSGATVVWSTSDPGPGAVTQDSNDQTKAVLVAGATDDSGTVSASVILGDGETGFNVTSETLTVTDGDPDGGSIVVGAEIP